MMYCVVSIVKVDNIVLLCLADATQRVICT